MQTETINRAKKIEESREIITEVEDVIGRPLTDGRFALRVAGKNITSDSLYVEEVVKAMSEAAAHAIESGHDELASEAIQSVTELEEVASEDE